MSQSIRDSSLERPPDATRFATAIEGFLARVTKRTTPLLASSSSLRIQAASYTSSLILWLAWRRQRRSEKECLNRDDETDRASSLTLAERLASQKAYPSIRSGSSLITRDLPFMKEPIADESSFRPSSGLGLRCKSPEEEFRATLLTARSAVSKAKCPKTNPAPRLDCG